MRSRLQPARRGDVHAFLGAPDRRQWPHPGTPRGQRVLRGVRPRLPGQRDDRPRAALADDQHRRRAPGRDLDVDVRPSRPVHLLHRRARGGEPVAALSRGARAGGRTERGHPVRRRGAPRNLRSRQPHRAQPRRLARLVDGRSLEQQAFSTLLAHHARRGTRACADIRRRRLDARGPGAGALRADPRPVPDTAAR